MLQATYAVHVRLTGKPDARSGLPLVISKLLTLGVMAGR